MKIETDAQLIDAARQASELLQAITDYAGRTSRPDAAVRFPRGFIRSASEQRKRLEFIVDPVVRANLSYTLLMSDTVYWLLVRTDLGGMAAQMLIKLLLFMGGTMVESITKSYLKGICGKGYKERTGYLATIGVIDSRLKDELDWLWDARNKMHLFLLEDSEYTNEYNNSTYTRCVSAFKDLVEALSRRGPL